MLIKRNNKNNIEDEIYDIDLETPVIMEEENKEQQVKLSYLKLNFCFLFLIIIFLMYIMVMYNNKNIINKMNSIFNTSDVKYENFLEKMKETLFNNTSGKT